MFVAPGLCDHVDCGFTDKLNNFDVLEQYIALRAKVQRGLDFETKLTCFAASVLCRGLVAYQSRHSHDQSASRYITWCIVCNLRKSS